MSQFQNNLITKPRPHSFVSSQLTAAHVPEKVHLEVAGEEAAGCPDDEYQQPQSGQEEQQGMGGIHVDFVKMLNIIGIRSA